MEIKIQNLKNSGRKMFKIVENGSKIVVPGLCQTISRRKVLEDGFEDGGDGNQNPKFEKFGT